MEMFVVFGGYDYEGEDVVGVFADMVSAQACFEEEVADDDYDFIGIRAYQGREYRQVIYQRLAEEEDFI
jgi:hypothetical protein